MRYKNLQVAPNFVKESIISTSSSLEDLNSVRIIPLVDLEMLKSAIASTEWLLSEKKLFGGHYTNDFNSQTIGVYYRLRELDTLNSLLDIYNRYEEPSVKRPWSNIYVNNNIGVRGKTKLMI